VLCSTSSRIHLKSKSMTYATLILGHFHTVWLTSWLSKIPNGTLFYSH
jgi:hypothetical protein